MTYTINDKDYTEFDINKRCAELMGIEVELSEYGENMLCESYDKELYMPTECPLNGWEIIEKCWDELNKHCYADNRTRWQLTMQKHNCTKLIAACICFIEMNED
jgi:hypothetical protein